MKKVLLLITLCLITFNLKAQDNAKLDSILTLQKQMNAQISNSPLANKKFGVELNLFRFLTLDDAFTMSGTVSFFNWDRNAEIAFPMYLQIANDLDYEVNSFTLDGHYRYFLGKSQNGFYLSGFARTAFLRGNTSSEWYDDGTQSRDIKNAIKFGIGFGLGYRYFSYKGLYWGTSFSVGRYFIGKNDQFYGSFLDYDDDAEMIVDFEFLKFGWSF